MLQETKPQAIYRAEYYGVRDTGGLILLASLVSACYFLSRYFWFPDFLWPLVLVVPGHFLLKFLAERRALLRCQRAGLLGYVRTREVVHNKRLATRDAMEFSCRIPLAGNSDWPTYAAYLGGGALIHHWNSIVLLPIIPPLAIRALIVMPLALLLITVLERIKRFGFRIDAQGIRTPLRRVPWGGVEYCTIVRDYGSVLASETMPVLTAQFFSAHERLLVTLRLNAQTATGPEDFVRLEETIYAYCGGRDDLPGSDTAPS